MEYSGKLPDSNVNVSKRSPLQELFVLLGGLVGLCFIFYLCLGWAVDYSVQHISPEEEKDLYNLMKFPTGEGEKTSDRTLAVQALLKKLQKCAPLPYQISVDVNKSKQVNAAAFPGGHILIFSGLLNQMDSENELVFVLGHELGHFKHRDHLRGLGRGLVLGMISLFLLGPDSDVGEFLFSALGVADRTYSRQQESAADEYALEVLNCHYGHVGGSTRFFELLRDMNQTPEFLKYYSTHPSDQKRIDNLNTLTIKKNFKVDTVKPWAVSMKQPTKKTGHPDG
jgi:Zn-dependent protease with chaperone function